MPEGSAIASGLSRMQDLPQSLFAVAGWSQCLAALDQGQQATFDSVWGSSCALLCAALLADGNRPVVFVFPSEKQASDFTEDWGVFSSKTVELFPTMDFGRLDDLSADPGFGQRLRLLKRLTGGGPLPSFMVATSIQALSHPVPRPQALADRSLELVAGQRGDIEQVKQWLAGNAYQHVPAVRIPGEFSVRGGIVDIFAPDWTAPARVEWFDSDIESIRFFDVDSQRSTEKCSGIQVSGIPPKADDGGGHLLDFLPSGTLVVLFEPQEIESSSHSLIDRQATTDALHPLAAIQASFRPHAVAMAGRLVPETDTAHCRLPVTLIERFSGDISEVRREIDQLVGDRRLLLLANTESEIRRVSEILAATRTAQRGRLEFFTGGIHAGFGLDHIDTLILGSDQLFNRSDLRRQAVRKNARPIDSFIDLQKGDLIVHLAHGIGRFRGLRVLHKDDQRTEHLELEFHGGTRIYLPATKIGLVQKYVGGTRHRPQLRADRRQHLAETETGGGRSGF